jgi:uncharacterized protein YjiS (DUF1127 family)
MSTIFASSTLPQAQRRGSGCTQFVAAMKRRWTAYITCRIEQAAIAELWKMSDRELRDIGITRSEIMNAVKGICPYAGSLHRAY